MTRDMTPVAIGGSTPLADRIVESIASVVGPGPVVLHEPTFSGNEWQYLKDCLDSTFVSSVGQYVNRFEEALASATGGGHVIAVVNGTAALHVALLLSGVERDDEVLVPSLSFIATANAVRYCGAIPHFVDSELRTLGVSAAALDEHLSRIARVDVGRCVNRETGRTIRALVPMHTFGHPVDIRGLLALADRYNLAIVEDAAEALGSTIDGRHAGTFGRFGTLSFNGNKTITTGGGGAIMTNDATLAARAKHITTTAKLPHRWRFDHDQVGFNYRMPNLNAALGCAQLEDLASLVAKKRDLFDRYRTAFSAIPDAVVFAEPAGCRSNYWLQTILLDESVADQREAVLQATNDAGFMTRPVWTPLHELQPFADCPRADLPVVASLARRAINLPSSSSL